jgi:hypothetical protein
MKVWTITLCHNDPGIIEDSIARYYATKSPDVETNHILVDQHWPLGRADTKSRLQALAEKFGCTYLNPGKNLGLHDGFNWAVNQLAIPPDAGVIGYDPDSYPLTEGWDMAMCQAFVNDPTIAWLSLWHTHCDRQMLDEGAGVEAAVIGGIKTLRASRPVMNSICMFRRRWLSMVGGLHEGNAYYGGLEVDMWYKLGVNKWVFLPEFKEDLRFHDRVDPIYREYKWEHAHTRAFPGSFEEFVRAKYPHRL